MCIGTTLNNDIAQLHLLSKEDKLFFKKLEQDLSNKISEICQRVDLPGNWGLSPDLEWLVKVGD